MAKPLQPLQNNIAIVDPKTGLPTDFFIRYMQQQVGTGFVPSSRTIKAGHGLTGGGDLTQDRTISLDANLDDLNDVASTSPTDGQVLTYVAVDGEWEPKDPTGGGGAPTGEAAWKVDAVGTGASQNVNIPDINPAKQKVMVFVNGLRWQTSEYTIAGNVVTLTTNSAGDSIEIVGPLGKADGTSFVVDAVGTGAAQNITLPFSALTTQSVMVFVNGLRWQTSEYTISGATLTLTTNSAGDSIEIVGPLGFVLQGGGGSGLSPVTLIQVAAGAVGHSGPANIVFPAATTPGNVIAIVVETYSQVGITPPAGFYIVQQYSGNNQTFALMLGISTGQTIVAPSTGDWWFGTAYELSSNVGYTQMVFQFVDPANWKCFALADVTGGGIRIFCGGSDGGETWAVTSPATGVTTDYVGNSIPNHTGIIARLDHTVPGFVGGTRSGSSQSIGGVFVIGGS